jgi:FkbM family methyltransferase
MFQLFREIFKPAVAYLSKTEYREWIAVKSACRNKAPGTAVTLKIAGFTVSGLDAPSFLYLYEEIFVRKAFDTSFTKKDPVIFCCGANIGLEIFFFKKHFPECKIKAFEADPEISAVLKKNVERNKLQDVEIISAAVWTENGTISFNPDGALGGTAGKGEVTIPSARLAYHLNEAPFVDLLLLDIEGAETEVLKDCKEQLLKVENLFVEWHSPAKDKQNLDELLLLLSSCGFRYRLNNKLPEAPFIHRIIEGGFDAMVEIYAQKK